MPFKFRRSEERNKTSSQPVKSSSAPPNGGKEILGGAFYKHFTPNGVRIGIGDAVILIYIAAFVRQYLWIISNNILAWVLTILVSGLIWSIHVRTKDQPSDRTPMQFWLVVALPLFFVYAMRAAFPDTGFDILDYRLINSERALRGFPFLPGDFFPSRFPFNPAPDMVTGITRHLLGYRLGTIINYFVLLWTGTILNRLLARHVNNVWLRSLGVLLILLTEHALFVINNYMVDLLALPLLLEAARLSFSGDRQTKTVVRLALYLGASIAFKLTNLAFALPIIVAYIFNIRGQPRPNLFRTALSLGLSFAAPLLPFTAYIYWQTGNPVFPLYNKIFRSPFWPAADLVGVRWSPVVDDPRWLDMRLWEQLLWPVLLPFQLEHTAGGLGPHTGRLSICFVAALLGLLLWTKDKSLRYLSFITLFGAILWSSISGMLRYATYVELAGGVIVICFAARLYRAVKDSPKLRLLKRGAFVFLLSILVVQSAIACVYAYRFEWGSRPSFFENPKAYLRDSKYFLRDYSLASFLPARERALIDPVETWAESDALEGGIEALLKSDAPALCLYMPEYFETEVSGRRFEQALTASSGKKLFALTLSDHLEGALFNIKRAGLGVRRVTQVVIPYYSETTRLHMSLIEVLPAAEANTGEQISATKAPGALPDSAYRAELTWAQTPPAVLRSGLRETVYVKVRNVSEATWPALGQAEARYRLSVGNHWLDANGKIVINDDGRSLLPYDLKPQEEIEVPLTITPPQIAGDYMLEIDMVQEAVTWFSFKRSSTLKTRIKVE